MYFLYNISCQDIFFKYRVLLTHVKQHIFLITFCLPVSCYIIKSSSHAKAMSHKASLPLSLIHASKRIIIGPFEVTCDWEGKVLSINRRITHVVVLETFHKIQVSSCKGQWHSFTLCLFLCTTIFITPTCTCSFCFSFTVRLSDKIKATKHQ